MSEEGKAASHLDGFKALGAGVAFLAMVGASVWLAYRGAMFLGTVVGEDKADVFMVCEVVIVFGFWWRGHTKKQLDRLEAKVDKLDAMLREEIGRANGG